MISQESSYRSKVAAIGRRLPRQVSVVDARQTASRDNVSFSARVSVSRNLLVRMTPVKLLEFGCIILTMVMNSGVV